METMYNKVKGPCLFRRGSINRFGVITSINIYRCLFTKYCFPIISTYSNMLITDEEAIKLELSSLTSLSSPVFEVNLAIRLGC
jgi:hypothetical protein